MADTFVNRIKAAWNAFSNKDPAPQQYTSGHSSSLRPDRAIFTAVNQRSIIGGLYLRGAVDVAALPILHCRTNDDLQFLGAIKSPLNDCLTLSANIDQTGRALIQDLVLSMYNDGAVAIVPVDTSANPLETSAFDIYSMRAGQIVEWYPRHVRVKVYNDKTGLKEEITLPKSVVAIIENPFYSVMNESNSIIKQLVSKLSQLNSIDASGVGKLDLIIQMPFAVKSDERQKQAEERVANLEAQLNKNKVGIAYIDAVEKVTQLNRPVENNLLAQVELLTSMLYSQLGITQSVFDGTADEPTMLNYHARMVEPTMSAIVNSMKRTFITKTARSQGQSIMAFRDPFKLVPIKDLAEFADKFTRNEIVTSNELRSIIGLKPSDDPSADELRNKNLNKATDATEADVENPGVAKAKPKKETV